MTARPFLIMSYVTFIVGTCAGQHIGSAAADRTAGAPAVVQADVSAVLVRGHSDGSV